MALPQDPSTDHSPQTILAGAGDDLVLLVLRDPPGRRSYASLAEDLSYSVDVSLWDAKSQYRRVRAKIKHGSRATQNFTTV